MTATAVLVLAMIAADPLAVPAPPSSGTISVESLTVIGESSDARSSYVTAVDNALAAKGFTPLEEPGHAGLIASVSLARDQVGTTSAAVPATRAIVAMPGGASGVGASMSLDLPTAKVRTTALERTRLELRIARRGQDGILWQGTAVTVRAAGARGGQSRVIADLTEALLRDYPVRPEAVISVP